MYTKVFSCIGVGGALGAHWSLENIKHVVADIMRSEANISHGAADILSSAVNILLGSANICLPKTHMVIFKENKTKSLLDAIIKSFCNVLDKPVFITNWHLLILL